MRNQKKSSNAKVDRGEEGKNAERRRIRREKLNIIQNNKAIFQLIIKRNEIFLNKT